MMTGPINALRSCKDVIKELRFTAKHIERKSHEIIFSKCSNPRCNHCASNPIISKTAWAFLSERNFKWPNPVPSTNFSGHYKTFIEISEMEESATGD